MISHFHDYKQWHIFRVYTCILIIIPLNFSFIHYGSPQINLYFLVSEYLKPSWPLAFEVIVSTSSFSSVHHTLIAHLSTSTHRCTHVLVAHLVTHTIAHLLAHTSTTHVSTHISSAHVIIVATKISTHVVRGLVKSALALLLLITRTMQSHVTMTINDWWTNQIW